MRGVLPARVTALSHHPYAGRKAFPPTRPKGTPLNALGLPDPGDFTPAYEACFPEYFASALQTETIVRDMAPLTTRIYGVAHGRFARPPQARSQGLRARRPSSSQAPGSSRITSPAASQRSFRPVR